ncbi:glutamate synthase [bacterium]|nr:glutamate synthase [bacterium]
MTGKGPALTPYPLRVLLGRIAAEWESRHRVYDMPSGRFFSGDQAHDLSVDFGVSRAATPIGPAAGPHTQLAQNIVLGWLAGARVFELKTVQVLDELEIPRPCIDMETIGYNVEWSQELRIEQSIEEYAKAWLMLHLLQGWEPLSSVVGDASPFAFDMSIGYDLDGITSRSMDGFVRAMLDCSEIVDDLRGQIPEPFAAQREIVVPDRIVGAVTLSTFHGCPPDEIEAIARHMMSEYGLDVVVKLNPTLLGYDEVGDLLGRKLGYDHIRLNPGAFEADLQFDRALDMIGSLRSFARESGKSFGVKLTNTLVVENDRGVLPGEQAYLSGAPLHVLAVSLLDRLVDALPGTFRLGAGGGDVTVSFSAGIDRENVATAVGLGLVPVTVCSALLKPGGYGHLSSMLKALGTAMTQANCTTIDQWVEWGHSEALQSGHRDAVAAYAARLVDLGSGERYTAAGTAKSLRSVDSDLQVWDCVSCNLCVTVCPNDAMIHLSTPDDSGLEQKWQYMVLAEVCNDCGNCTTFCPERGDPFLIKPRLYIDVRGFAKADRQAYLVSGSVGGGLHITANTIGSAESDMVETVVAWEGDGLAVRAEDLLAR